MQDEWIWLASHGQQYDYYVTLYLNPNTETVKKVRREFSHFSYHDEESWDEYVTMISIEEALEWVYPNEYAISVILKNINKDYSETLKRLAQKKSSSE